MFDWATGAGPAHSTGGPRGEFPAASARPGPRGTTPRTRSPRPATASGASSGPAPASGASPRRRATRKPASTSTVSRLRTLKRQTIDFHTAGDDTGHAGDRTAGTSRPRTRRRRSSSSARDSRRKISRTTLKKALSRCWGRIPKEESAPKKGGRRPNRKTRWSRATSRSSKSTRAEVPAVLEPSRRGEVGAW